jgi:hypothetical protein
MRTLEMASRLTATLSHQDSLVAPGACAPRTVRVLIKRICVISHYQAMMDGTTSDSASDGDESQINCNKEVLNCSTRMKFVLYIPL